MKAGATTAPPARSTAGLAPAGLAIGFLGSLCGIGGGLFAGPLLHLAFGFELRRATGTALVLVVATTAAATATEAARADSALRWGLVAVLVVGMLVGAQLGFAFSERVSDRFLRALFAVALLAVSVPVLLAPSAPHAAQATASGGEALGAGAFVWGGLAGALGGFVVPVLGVGGGLVVVPALFLGIPGLGFDGARAAALAAGLVGSARSLVLKARARRVSWRHGLALGAGALVGAALGVVALDAARGLIEVGRIALGLTLAAVAARFGRDALRGRAASGGGDQAQIPRT